MKLLPSLILTFGIASISVTSNGQGVPLGQWKDYLSYRQGVTVAQGNGKIFCVAGSAVFSYNTSDNSIERYNKVTGLSDVGPTVARFSTATNTLVIGYSDGNIDLIQGGRITNVPDLKIASVQGSKSINNIYFIGNQAYISCGQGILQVDLVQDIIMYSYKIGPGGSALNVYGVSVCNDTLFAATAAGAYKISLNDGNFSDFTHWKLIKVSPVPYPTSGKSVVFDCITTVGDSLFMAYSSGLSTINNSTPTNGQDTLFTYYNGKWSYTHLTGGGAFNNGSQSVISLETSVVKNANYLVLTVSYNLQIFNSLGNEVGNMGSYSLGTSFNPEDALLDGNMNIWIADGSYGLVKVDPSYNSQAYDPPGPFSNAVASLNVAGDGTIWITPGGYTPGGSAPDYHNLPLSTFQDGTWSIIPPPTPSTNMNDVNCLAMDPNNPKHVFAGSFDNGIWEYNNTSIVNDYESPYIAPVGVAPGLWRVAGIGFDTLGDLWSTSCIAASNYLAVKKTDGTWIQFNFSSFFSTPGLAVLQLLVTKTGAKWMIMPGIGILAFQDNGTFSQPSSTNTEIINSGTHHGALPSINIYCMTEDLNGAIWVGTDQKVVVYYSPDNVYDGNGDWDASNVYVNQNGYTQYLMQNQTTNCIAVDGANRKWIGTQGGGAFLMSADGTQQILNFTSANSPLLSNNIEEIAINPKTGEVFFGTDQGIVSYRGTATEGNTQFTNVYAYPNPVPHGYDGPVAITGLVTNSDVKITTINGEIVYHTTALGGQAIWYGTNFDGKRVQTGVYLVFCASPDGSQTHIAKLLFIN